MEFRRAGHQQIGRLTKPNGICKKHPKHQNSPGVCPICLREKLSKLSSSSSRSNTTITLDSSCSSSSLSSMSSSDYSDSCSSCSSPVHHRHYSMASDGRGFSMILFKSGKNVLTKSRSLAFITRRRDEGEVALDHDKKKKTSFWSKLLRPKSKRVDESLDHTRSMTRVH